MRRKCPMPPLARLSNQVGSNHHSEGAVGSCLCGEWQSLDVPAMRLGATTTLSHAASARIISCGRAAAARARPLHGPRAHGSPRALCCSPQRSCTLHLSTRYVQPARPPIPHATTDLAPVRARPPVLSGAGRVNPLDSPDSHPESYCIPPCFRSVQFLRQSGIDCDCTRIFPYECLKKCTVRTGKRLSVGE